MIDKLIVKFEGLAIKRYNIDLADYRANNKCINEMNNIVHDVFATNAESRFFETLFLNPNPLVRIEAASYSVHYNYDLYKSLAIITAITKDKNIIYSKERSANNFHKNTLKDFVGMINKKVAFFERVADKNLYKQFFVFY